MFVAIEMFSRIISDRPLVFRGQERSNTNRCHCTWPPSWYGGSGKDIVGWSYEFTRHIARLLLWLQNYVDLMEALADMAGLIPLKDEMPVGADPEVVRKWLWSGPLLPCHYRICQDSTHGLSAPIPLCASTDSEGSSAFTGALAEIRKVNTALEDQVFSP